MKKGLLIPLLALIAAVQAKADWSISEDGTLTITSNYYFSKNSSYPWHSQRSDIKNVVIADGVTEIGYVAFQECANLETVSIANSVTTIYDYAFYKCSGLKTINIPDGVKVIDEATFQGCSSLESIELPNGITKIASYAFYGCTKLANVNIPTSVITIGDAAFYETNISSVVIPEGATTIGEGAFMNCSNLVSVTIPKSLTKIAQQAFAYCNSNLVVHAEAATTPASFALRSFDYDANVTIYIPYGTKAAYQEAWIYDYNYIEPIYSLSDGVLTLWGDCNYEKATDYPWDNARESIEKVIISNEVSTIGEKAFKDCSKELRVYATSITDPFEISNEAFDDSTFIYIPNGKKDEFTQAWGKQYNYIEGWTLSTDSVLTISCDYNYDDSYQYPWYKKRKNIKTVVVEEGVTIIGESAFESYDITSITIPQSVKHIGKEAFKGCTSLTGDIVIPEGVTTIEDYTFCYCGITSIKIPKSLTSLGYRSLEIYDESFIVYAENATTPPTLGEKVFYYIPYVYITKGTKEAYIKAWGSRKYFIEVASIDTAVAKISAIGIVEFTDSCKTLIDNAKSAFEDLSDSQKALVTNAETLTAAIAKYEELKTIAEANQAAADAVITKIEAIGTVVYTETCKALIDDAKAAFDALTDEQKARVTNAETLTEAIATYESLQPATGIKEIFYKRNSNDNAWYDLLGHKFDTKPTVPGLYIHQGERVLVK